MFKPVIILSYVVNKMWYLGRDSFSDYGCPFTPAQLIEMAIFSPLNCFSVSVRTLLTMFLLVYFWVLCSIPLVYVSLLSITHILDYCDYIRNLKMRLTVCFLLYYCFFKIILAILFPLPFHTNYRIILSASVKTLAGILIGILWNMHINLGRIGIFSILSLLIQKHSISLCLFRSYGTAVAPEGGMLLHYCQVEAGVQVSHLASVGTPRVGFSLLLGCGRNLGSPQGFHWHWSVDGLITDAWWSKSWLFTRPLLSPIQWGVEGASCYC